MFQSLQLIIIIIVLLANGSFVLASFGNSFGKCPGGPSSCPNGSAIKYPFWIDDGSVSCSGYPGFEIRCDAGNGKPVMNISNHRYYVLYFVYIGYPLGGTLTLLDVDIDGKECPQPQRNLSIQSQPFLYLLGSNRQNITIFYNCTNPPENVVQQIPCLPNYNNNTIRSYAFQEPPKGFNWLGNCLENVVQPVMSEYTSNGQLLPLANYTQAIKRGFELDWYYPKDCQDCVSSGGQCSANNTTGGFTCNCTMVYNGRMVVNRDNDICQYQFSDADDYIPILRIVITAAGILALVLVIIYRRKIISCCRINKC